MPDVITQTSLIYPSSGTSTGALVDYQMAAYRQNNGTVSVAVVRADGNELSSPVARCRREQGVESASGLARQVHCPIPRHRRTGKTKKSDTDRLRDLSGRAVLLCPPVPASRYSRALLARAGLCCCFASVHSRER